MRILILCLTVLAACKSPAPKEEPANVSGWSGGMQNMAGDVEKLLPYLYDREAFVDPKNHDRIKKSLRDFAKAAHKLEAGAGQRYIGDELLLEYTLGNLQDDLNRAAQSFETGQTDYARATAKNSLNNCFSCHSVTAEGASAPWDLSQVHAMKLAPLEKADLLVAARKYEKALQFMESQLSLPDFFKNYGTDYEALLRRYLALLIRVEKDPARATQALDKILNRGDAPQFVIEQASGWRKSLEAWRREKPRPVKNPKDLFKQVEQRFARAKSLQSFEKDHAGDVEYLRATALLHLGLKMTKSPSDQARALYLLGKSYEVLDELGSWNLHESYYEACVRREPHTALAKTCFDRLEASLVMGYSGSAGVNLPADERARLERLKEKVR